MSLQFSGKAYLDDPSKRPFSPVISAAGRVAGARDASRGTYLEAMRQAANSVAVVTTDGPGGRHGATVSAFCSVSADPPTMLVCLRSNSRICAAVDRNGVFTVNILPETARSIARAFTGEFDAVRADRFDGIPVVELAGLAPGIEGATSFACRITRTDVQHTHTIFIGEVAHVSSGSQPPLTYHDGAYCGLQRQA